MEAKLNDIMDKLHYTYGYSIEEITIGKYWRIIPPNSSIFIDLVGAGDFVVYVGSESDLKKLEQLIEVLES